MSPTKSEAPTAATVEASGVKTPHKKGINMLDSTVTQAARAITVPFHGANLYVVEHDGQPFAPMRPIVEGMGLAWQPQHRKLNESRFSTCVTEMVMQLPGDRQRRSVTCMPLRKLPGWLMSIEPGKVKNAAVRERVVQYQNECDDALWQYWNDGIAVNPRAAFAVNPGDVLTQDQAETLRLTLKAAAERLPKEKQGALMAQGWSKLKAHFKVSYRQIPQHEFSEAVSIVTRHAAEWEVVDEELVGRATLNEVMDRYARQLEEPNSYPVEPFLPLWKAINRKIGRSQDLTMKDIQQWIERRVVVDSADLARTAAICLSRLEGRAARDEGKPFLRGKVRNVDVQADGSRNLHVVCGDIGLWVEMPLQPGEEPFLKGDSVRLEYEKGANPLCGPYTRVSRDWMAA